MLLKERKFVVELSEKDIYELKEALEARIEDLEEACKIGGGVVANRHMDATQKLFNMVDFLNRECEHDLYQ